MLQQEFTEMLEINQRDKSQKSQKIGDSKETKWKSFN
jgi:hypothetical protein